VFYKNGDSLIGKWNDDLMVDGTYVCYSKSNEQYEGDWKDGTVYFNL
jgi:hypothetical protein